jgi:phosphomannomutase/phosphoglucomutase
MQKIKAIVFDLDDTLYDFSNKIWPKAVEDSIKVMIREGLDTELEKAMGFAISLSESLGTLELFKKIVKESGSKNKKLAELGIKNYYDWALKENLLKLIKPFPDVPQTLNSLKRKYKLVLLTFGAKEAQRKKIEALNLKNFFDLILINPIEEEENKLKYFREIIKKLKLKPDEIICVGDKIEDEIKAANICQIKTVRILQGRFKRKIPKDKLTTPDFRINKISQLPSLLNVLEDPNPENIFRAYDIRGIWGVNMDTKLVENLGKALGNFFGKGKTIALGRDARLSGEIIEKALIKGIISTGCNVLKLGIVPTQVTYFSVPFLNLDGGVMITASHNPPDWNGFKLIKEKGMFIFGDELIKIKEWALKGKFKEVKKGGKISNYEKIFQDYSDYVLKRINLKRETKVVLDTGNGVAGKIARKIFEKVGCEVRVINEELDGNFASRPSEPDEFSLEELSKKVVEEKADFGAGFDGDGDRIMFVDDKGRIISSGSLIIMLFSDYLLKKNTGEKIVYDICASFAVEPFIRERGGIPIVTKVGHVFIKDKMTKENAIFGGESSNHFYFRDVFNFDDGIFAGLKMAELLSNSEIKFSKMIDSLPKFFYISEWSFDVPDRIKFKIIEQMKKDFQKKGIRISDLDGIKVFFDDGWIVWRPSNTAPQIKAYVEAKSKEKFDDLLKFAEETLNKYLE